MGYGRQPLVALSGRPANIGGAFISGMDAANRNRLARSRETLNAAHTNRINTLNKWQGEDREAAQLQQQEDMQADSLIRFHGMMRNIEQQYANDPETMTMAWQDGLRRLGESGVPHEKLMEMGPYQPGVSTQKLGQAVQMLPGYQQEEQQQGPKLAFQEDATGRKWAVNPYTGERVRPLLSDQEFDAYQQLNRPPTPGPEPTGFGGMKLKDVEKVWSSDPQVKAYRTFAVTADSVKGLLEQREKGSDTAAIMRFARAMSPGVVTEDDFRQAAQAEGGVLAHIYSFFQKAKDGTLRESERNGIWNAVQEMHKAAHAPIYQQQQRMITQLGGHNPDTVFSSTGKLEPFKPERLMKKPKVGVPDLLRKPVEPEYDLDAIIERINQQSLE